MRTFVKVAVVALTVIGLIYFLSARNPDTSAIVKCEFGIEEATVLPVSLSALLNATVTGDEFNGTVRIPFDAGMTSYVGECVFKDGRFHRISLNGRIVAGR